MSTVLEQIKGQRILVTGATGFLGQALVQYLESHDISVVGLSSRECDLRILPNVLEVFRHIRPDIVIHCAVQGGGIGWMKDHPVESGLDNYRMNTNVLDSAFQSGVRSFVGVSSACVYPKYGRLPYVETDVWGGYPEPFNGPYALSKRAMMDLGRAYASQHGFHCTFPILANLYGPGDHLSPDRAHVIADLMLRASSNPETLSVWGTGIAEREFLYIDDAVEGILSTLTGQAGGFYNVGTGISTAIRKLAELIAGIASPSMGISFDSSKPDGQLRKVMSVEKVRYECGWSARVELAEGIRRTWEWYIQQEVQ